MQLLKVLDWAYFWSHNFFDKIEKNLFFVFFHLLTDNLGRKTTPYAFFGRLNEKKTENPEKYEHSFFLGLFKWAYFLSN